MKINEVIKAVTKDYMPIKMTVMKAKKEGRELTDDEKDKYFELSNTLEFYKILKGMFMEQVTKNTNGFIDALVAEEKLHKKTENVKDANGKMVTVEYVVESMDTQIDLVPDYIYQPLFEKLVKGHKENIEAYTKRNDMESVKKEELELKILEQYLPKEASREDIVSYLNEYYPNGVEQKAMGKVIGEVKKAFERADGKLIAECVKSKIA